MSAVVHIIDDDVAVRQSLAFLLASAGFPAKVHESAEAFFAVFDPDDAGCVLTDVRMPGIDGLELQRRLEQAAEGVPLIVMTGHADVSLAVQAMKSGAVDVIEKPFEDTRLLSSVRAALDRRDVQTRHEAHVRQARAKLAALSGREREVFEGLIAGHPNKTIAYDLGLSHRTVEVHRANIMSKMGARSLSDLVRLSLSATPAPKGA